MAISKGVLACESALERLLAGKPYVSNHCGINSFDITPATVSVEAGFDKGYLKRRRDIHKPLIARIDSLKESKNETSNKSIQNKLKKALKKNEELESKLESSMKVKDKVLTQNLILLQKVRELEKQLSECSNVRDIRSITF